MGGLGYSVWLSSADQPRRVIAVLSLHSTAAVTELIPGYLQKVIFEDTALLHLHAPSNSVIQNKIVFFQQLADHISFLSFFIIFLLSFSIIKYNTIYYDTVYNMNTLAEARAKAKRI